MTPTGTSGIDLISVQFANILIKNKQTEDLVRAKAG